MKSTGITKRQFALRLFIGLVFICILLTSCSICMLKRGISVSSFTIANTSVTSFSLIWKEKLELSIDTLITSSDSKKKDRSKNSRSFSGSDLITAFKAASVFSKVSIDTLQVGPLKGSLHFDQSVSDEPGHFIVQSSEFSLHSSLSLDNDTLLIDVTDVTVKPLQATASGKIRVDTRQEIITAEFTADIAKTFPVRIDLTVDRKQLTFTGRENGKISTITPLVDLFGLDHSIQCWITDYLTGTRYNLKTFHGTIPWDDPLAILSTLYAEVRVDDCEYTFAPGLEAIKTAYTDVVFKNGVLAITPHESTFYGQDGEKSWLDIDFNDPAAIILTAYIITNAQANDDILTLLNYYDIPLPFKQTRGKTDTNLTLAINLNDTIVTAKGLFIIADGEIEENKNRYEVKNVRVSLVDSLVNIEDGTLHYGDIFDAEINGLFDAANGTGDLTVQMQKLRIQTEKLILQLDDSEEMPSIIYHIEPDRNTLTATRSYWKLDSTRLELAAFTTPFSFTEYAGNLPPTLLTFPLGVSAMISGPFSFKKFAGTIQCKILHYDVNDIQLLTKNAPVELKYENKLLTISNLKPTKWAINNSVFSLSPHVTTYKNNILTTQKCHTSYANLFDSDILNFEYNLKKDEGNLTFANLSIENESIGQLLTSGNDTIDVTISSKDQHLSITIPDIALTFRTEADNKWSVKQTDLSKIYPHCELLQKFGINTGSITVSSSSWQKPYNFAANITLPYALLYQDNKAVTQITATGEITDTGINAKINDAINVQYDKQLQITSKNIAYNIPGIVEFIKIQMDQGSDNPPEPQTLAVTFEAENSALVINDQRQLLADTIHYDNTNDQKTITLTHAGGKINVEVDGKNFSLLGEKLNDDFMNALFPGAAFSEGTMSAAADGSFASCSILIKIENTTLKEFRLMHNVLALLNTIPALITFSLPEFDTQGLPIKSAIMGFRLEDGFAPLETLLIDSPEFTLAGKGWMDFNKGLVDIDANIITSAGANISHIPLAGFILAGDEKRPTITLKISGDLKDPDVTTSAFKEVSTMPFAILYRTLTLPVHLIRSMGGTEKIEDMDE